MAYQQHTYHAQPQSSQHINNEFVMKMRCAASAGINPKPTSQIRRMHANPPPVFFPNAQAPQPQSLSMPASLGDDLLNLLKTDEQMFHRAQQTSQLVSHFQQIENRQLAQMSRFLQQY